ncbi:MAG: phenylalanine--tRNA ligase subunit alpha [Patescibacteria group bacterium]|nr:phenylalanine--tRNA ligase subunit alpha [Patescibacteria group bacterium]
MNFDEVKKIRDRFLKEVEGSKSSSERKKICKRYIEEELSSVFCCLKDLSGENKAKVGKIANELRQMINEKMKESKKDTEEKEEWLDVTLPGKKASFGGVHPLAKLQERCEEIFAKMGFISVEGPEMENEWYNFDALNFTPDHPVRDMQDTLFIKQKDREELESKDKLLMRTHTSPVQVRYMEKNEPPLRIIVPGRVFRNETTDSSHDINFYQLEGLMVGENISVANFRSVISFFFKELFKDNIEVRFRPSFFPFTEPSFEVDVSCTICNKKGCSVCQKTGWLEVVGAGMVHPNVLKSANIDSDKFNGFAFGVGLDRIAMVAQEIDSIRLFYSGDLRFLKQF